MLPVLHPDAAGIDVDAEEVFVAVPPDRAADSVRSFETFTQDLYRTKKCFYQKANHEPAFDLKAELFRIAGVDLTDVPGISAITAHTILIEVGPGLSRFQNASAFASWLGLCPDSKVSGGKVLVHRVTQGEKPRRNCTAPWSTVSVSRKELSRGVLPQDEMPPAAEEQPYGCCSSGIGFAPANFWMAT